MRHTTMLAAMLALAGCAALPYQPAHAPLAEGAVAPIAARGALRVSNAQPETDAVVVYAYEGTRLASSLNAITQAMVEQLDRALLRGAGAPDGDAGEAKSIALRVDALRSRHAGDRWTSELVFEARLGDGRVLRRVAANSDTHVLRDLDGCIAEGVRVLLADPDVRGYLAR